MLLLNIAALLRYETYCVRETMRNIVGWFLELDRDVVDQLKFNWPSISL